MIKNQAKNAWIDFDTTFEMWGVYDLDSGFCYNMFYTKEEAENYLKEISTCAISKT